MKFTSNTTKENTRRIILDKWRWMTDKELADYLGMKVWTLSKMRQNMGIRRQDIELSDRQVIAEILSLYANGVKPTRIANLMGKKLQHIERCIYLHWTMKNLNINREILIIKDNG